MSPARTDFCLSRRQFEAAQAGVRRVSDLVCERPMGLVNRIRVLPPQLPRRRSRRRFDSAIALARFPTQTPWSTQLQTAGRAGAQIHRVGERLDPTRPHLVATIARLRQTSEFDGGAL